MSATKPTIIIISGLLLIAAIASIIFMNQNNKPATSAESTNATGAQTAPIPDEVPRALARAFPTTDWTKRDDAVLEAVSGGPGKDGIPAIDEPTFVPLSEYTRGNDIQAITMKDGDTVKVYPYNILTWHEIVNDTVDGTPVAITFCPLCGSAIVFNRTLPNGEVSTFGVSGSLLESNMIMYDRATENLWQQSTGKTLAGSFHPAELSLESFQLTTMGDVKAQFPDALVLSEDTGYRRDYGRNPYAGYEESDQFIFAPSAQDSQFPSKTIMAAFKAGDTPVATPWLKLREAGLATIEIDDIVYTLDVSDTGELTITDNAGSEYPFYFEMWFSFAIQHGDTARIVPLPN